MRHLYAALCICSTDSHATSPVQGKTVSSGRRLGIFLQEGTGYAQVKTVPESQLSFKQPIRGQQTHFPLHGWGLRPKYHVGFGPCAAAFQKNPMYARLNPVNPKTTCVKSRKISQRPVGTGWAGRGQTKKGPAVYLPSTPHHPASFMLLKVGRKQ